jgi:imidazole glycerol-phosphate synthase subunit HisH
LKVAIIKYNAGNVQSVRYALNRLGIDPIVTDEAEMLQSADKVIFPGVGEASTAMNYLKSRNLDKLIKELKQPTLGICLGLQLMCKHSEENNTECLNIFPISVKKFPSVNHMKVPQIGWNSIDNYKGKLFKGLREGSYMYFVHSYHAELSEYTSAVTDYVLPYSSAIEKNNFYAVQFHTEKSSKEGALILKNFIEL